jgi:hypothetical protein
MKPFRTQTSADGVLAWIVASLVGVALGFLDQHISSWTTVLSLFLVAAACGFRSVRFGAGHIYGRSAGPMFVVVSALGMVAMAKAYSGAAADRAEVFVPWQAFGAGILLVSLLWGTIAAGFAWVLQVLSRSRLPDRQ